MQKILFAADTTDPALGPVWAMLRIRKQSIRVHLSSSAPIGVAKHDSKLIYLHESTINTHIRDAATVVYDFTDSTELQCFSSRSARVGATVHLHLAGKYPTFTKTRLLWRSDTFLLYLRDVIEMATQNNDAITTTGFNWETTIVNYTHPSLQLYSHPVTLHIIRLMDPFSFDLNLACTDSSTNS